MSAYAEAKRIYQEEDQFHVVSIGTGELNRPLLYHRAREWGKIGWVIPLLNCIFDGVSDAVDYQLDKILGHHYLRLQVTLGSSILDPDDDMDNVSATNINRLKEKAEALIEQNQDSLHILCDALMNHQATPTMTGS